MATSWVHSKTADFCGDYPEKPTVNDPASRPFVRCSLAAACIAGVVAMILFLFLTRSDGFRTVRRWDTEFVLAPNSWDEIDYSKTICPCNTTFAAWTLFVRFYWVDKALNRHNISNKTQFCDPLNSTGTSPQQLWKKGCYDMAFAGFDVNSSRLTVSSTTLQKPESLSYLISSSFRSYVDHEFSIYNLLAVNYSRDWLQLRWVNDILQNTASRPFMLATRLHMGNKTSTDQTFWNHTKDFWLFDPRQPTDAKFGVLTVLELTGGRAVSMEMDWTEYAKWCNPIYCDSMVTNSRLRRFVLAVGEVGGFSAVMLVFIQCLIWPLLRKIFRFDYSRV